MGYSFDFWALLNSVNNDDPQKAITNCLFEIVKLLDDIRKELRNLRLK